MSDEVSATRTSGYTPRSGRTEHSNARIIRVPEAMGNLPRQENLRGTVIRREPDGTLRIHTSEGEIDIKPDRDSGFREGQTVDIRVDPGHPPRTAALKPAPPELPRVTTTPVNIQISAEKTVATADPNQTQTSLKPGAQIQLVPLTPEALNQVLAAAQTIETLPNLITEKINITANLEALKVQTELTEQLEILLAPPESIKPEVPALTPGNTSLPLETIKTQILSPSPLPAENEIALPLTTKRETLPPLPDTDINQPEMQIEKISLMSLLTEIPAVNNFLTRFFPQSQIQETDLNISFPLTAPQPIKVVITSITPPETPFFKPETTNTDKPANQSQPILENLSEILQGKVIGTTPDQNLPVVKIFFPYIPEALHFSLQVPGLTLPIGTQLELVQTKSTTAITQPTPTASPSIDPLSYLLPQQPWPVMEELQQALIQIAPQIAQAFSATIPSPANPPQFMASTLLFIAAVTGNDLSFWLGDKATETLRRAGRTGLLTRLTQEGNALSRLASEPVTQEWRGMAVPLAWDNHIHKMALYYRKDFADGRNESNKSNGTRFILNLDLTRIGKVQLDGLFRPNIIGPARLDLILRTALPFSETMRQEMRQTYKNALDEILITGELSFQTGTDHWVNITPTPETHFKADV